MTGKAGGEILTAGEPKAPLRTVETGGALRATLQSSRMILVMLIVLAVLVGIVCWNQPGFYSSINLQNIGKRVGIWAIFAIGGALPIIAAGIDLSVGSIIGLIAVLLPMCIVDHGLSVWQAVPLVLAIGAAIGVAHGLLIARLNIQPFIVTLAGLLIYRGVARTLTEDRTKGFGIDHEAFRQLAIGAYYEIPIALFVMLGIALVVGVFLHGTIWGRHLYALGQNEEAARYSGIRVERLKIVAYTLSALLATAAGILVSLDVNGVQPSDTGKSYELYGIAAAVLGGCSLRGGEGTVVGVIVGTVVIVILRNLINLTQISTYIEDAMIGAVILGMVVIDEVIRRRAARRTTAA